MLSVIIPMGGEDQKGRRRRNLVETLGCIEEQTYRDFEVILVEEVFNGNIMFEDLTVDKYIKVEGLKLANRSWTRNVGANAAEGDRFLQIDGDILFDVDYFQRILGVKCPYFTAWSTCYRLTQMGAEEYALNREYNILYNNRDPFYGAIHPSVLGAAGFASSFKRDFYFNKLGGYNENFMGWGGEDNDVALRSVSLSGRLTSLDYTIYHQPHGDRRGGNNEFESTKKDPIGLTEKLKMVKLGKIEGPTRV